MAAARREGLNCRPCIDVNLGNLAIKSGAGAEIRPESEPANGQADMIPSGGSCEVVGVRVGKGGRPVNFPF